MGRRGLEESVKPVVSVKWTVMFGDDSAEAGHRLGHRPVVTSVFSPNDSYVPTRREADSTAASTTLPTSGR